MNHTVLRMSNETPEIIKRVNELHPWFYPVDIGGVLVTPGVGSRVSAIRLSQRTLYRKHLIVDSVLDEINADAITSILDVACNMGYWSYQYAKRCTCDIVGIEGRQLYVDQANLYYDVNVKDTGVGATFVTHDVTSPEAMEAIAAKGPYDLCICSGLLYHLADPYGFMRKLYEAAKPEHFVVDTRVVLGKGRKMVEPSGIHFNSLDKSANKNVTVPGRRPLVKTMEDLHYSVQFMQPQFLMPEATKNVDNYVNGNRVTMLCSA